MYPEIVFWFPTLQGSEKIALLDLLINSVWILVPLTTERLSNVTGCESLGISDQTRGFHDS